MTIKVILQVISIESLKVRMCFATKVGKYINRKLGLSILITSVVFVLGLAYIKNHKNIGSNDIVRKEKEEYVERERVSKSITTVETNDERILTQIGKKKLIVNSYYNIDAASNSKEGDMRGVVKEKWRHIKPKKEYTIGVLLPHFEDQYWVSANYGIINYAKELGVKVKLYAVGGYIEFGNQKEELMDLAEDNKIDGIVFATLDNTKFNSDVENIVHNDKPIVALVNDINAPDISAKAIVSYYDMGYKAGEYVVEDSAGKDIKIAFFPGPKESGWASDTLNGFKDAVSRLKKNDQKIDISNPFYGDTRPDVQRLHITSVLENNDDYDYLVGCAPAVIEAEKFIAKRKEKFKNIRIVSTYMTSDVFNLIKKGAVLASPSDQTIQQCRIALDMIIRILNGEKAGVDFPFQSGPCVPIISRDNISQFKYEDLFGSKEYIPVLNHMDK